MRALGTVVDGCIAESMPGGKWWEWNSDWMIGTCAERAGIALLNQPADRFGQFVTTCDEGRMVQPDTAGCKQFCLLNGGRCKQPASIHAVHKTDSMWALWRSLPHSAWAPVTDVRIRLMDGEQIQID